MEEFKIEETQKIQSGFQTPECYFEHFSVKMTAKLPAQKIKVTSIFSKKKKWILSVAAILILALGITFIQKISIKAIEPDGIALENYLASANLTENDLMEFLDEEDIKKIEANYSFEDKAIEDLLSQNPNLEQYIID